MDEHDEKIEEKFGMDNVDKALKHISEYLRECSDDHNFYFCVLGSSLASAHLYYNVPPDNFKYNLQVILAKYIDEYYRTNPSP